MHDTATAIPPAVDEGCAAPKQPADYHRNITPGFFARLFAVRHGHCGGKLLPVAERGSFLLKRCTRCGQVQRDLA